VLELGPSTPDWLHWIGLHPQALPTPATVERMLRLKVLLLVVIAIRRRCFRWEAKLPEALRAAARCGAPCPLFWSQRPLTHGSSGVPGNEAATVGNVNSEPGQPSLLQALRQSVGEVGRRVRHATQLALRAVDWPTTQAPEGDLQLAYPQQSVGGVSGSTSPLSATALSAIGGRNRASVQSPGLSRASVHGGGSLGRASMQLQSRPSMQYQQVRFDEETSQAGTSGGLKSIVTAVQPPGAPSINHHHQQQQQEEEEQGQEEHEEVAAELSALRYALQDWAERFWEEAGIDVSLFALLLAAFLAANALSLVYMCALAAGMVFGQRVRRHVWRWMVVPLLGLILLWQYLMLVGPPPTLHVDPSLGLQEDVAVSCVICTYTHTYICT
jgi:hypothetical protein